MRLAQKVSVIVKASHFHIYNIFGMQSQSTVFYFDAESFGSMKCTKEEGAAANQTGYLSLQDSELHVAVPQMTRGGKREQFEVDKKNSGFTLEAKLGTHFTWISKQVLPMCSITSKSGSNFIWFY